MSRLLVQADLRIEHEGLRLHLVDDGPGLPRDQIERLFADPGFARWFAHRYAGADES